MEKSKVIEIKKEVKIPGTDVVLEEGDKIQVINERYNIRDAVDEAREYGRIIGNKFFSNNTVDVLGWGRAATQIVDAFNSGVRE